MSFQEARKHIENYSSPRLQKHIVRILLMPPIYAIDCFIAMRFNSLGTYLLACATNCQSTAESSTWLLTHFAEMATEGL